ncbi:hypothetical protein KW783_04320, partial [Candidatus Parcubacteria bacterium]|nr:hypothetical protein [Candidatus Parcubacteria bacterium]
KPWTNRAYIIVSIKTLLQKGNHAEENGDYGPVQRNCPGETPASDKEAFEIRSALARNDNRLYTGTVCKSGRKGFERNEARTTKKKSKTHPEIIGVFFCPVCIKKIFVVQMNTNETFDS